MAVMSILVLSVWAFFMGLFVFSLCRAASEADEMSESWERARREQIEKDQ